MIKGTFDGYIKLLLLGDGAVGKSSLLTRFCDGTFENRHIMTIGVDFKEKILQVNNERLRVQLWDTAGQERFRNITPVYFRSAMGVLFVFDVCCRESFTNTIYWLRYLQDYANERQMTHALIGNKIDCTSLRVVDFNEGAILAKEFGMDYYETSALVGTNVHEIFVDIAATIREKQLANLTGTQVISSLNLSQDEFRLNPKGSCCGMKISRS